MIKLEGVSIYHAMWSLAVEDHEGQEYGEGVDYIFHVGEVVNGTREALISQPVKKESDLYYSILAIAAGHDLVEDTDITLEYLRGVGFNETVLSGIDALSRRVGETLETYLGRVISGGICANIVKKEDSLCNLKHSIRGGDNRRIDKYLKTLRLLNY